MNSDDVQALWQPARRHFMEVLPGEIMVLEHLVDGSKRMAALLGLSYPEAAHYMNIELTDELRWKLKLLAGPHGAVFKKMMEVKQGKSNEPG